jgi:hypothetical protein
MKTLKDCIRTGKVQTSLQQRFVSLAVIELDVP